MNREDIMRKIKARTDRDGNPIKGYAQNVEYLRKLLEGDDGNVG